MWMAVVAPALSGCSYVKSFQAHRAYNEYQQAVATGDLNMAQVALMKLVRIDEDVPDYWMQLGQLYLQLGNYRGAYDALSHAHELDRSNVEVVATMAQLAIYAGEIDLADEQAKNLELIAPDNPTVTMVKGFVALQQQDYEKASALADKLLAGTPTDPVANILKARILISQKQPDEAIALLEKQHQANANDRLTLRALSKLYQARNDWNNAARVDKYLYDLDPKDARSAQQLLRSALKAGNIALARQVSGPLLVPAARDQLIATTLDLWANDAPAGKTLPDLPQLARQAGPSRLSSFGDYLNRVGQPAAAQQLIGSAQVPVTHENAPLNAVLARSWTLQGRNEDARKLLDQVLAVEPDQIQALRGRSELLMRTGNTKQAIIDAQRIVTSNPQSGADRVLLARAFFAAGNKQEVRRTLWQAFHDMPEDESVFAALRNVLVSTGDLDGEQRLKRELADQKSSKLGKDLV